MVFDPSGNLIICDAGNHRLVKVTLEGSFLDEIGGFGFTREEFNSPTVLATSDNINLYLLDASNSRIVRLDYDLNWIADMDISSLSLEYPPGRGSAIAVNSFGDIYFADPENTRIIRFDSDLIVISKLTELGGFLEPDVMMLDANDNLYVINRDGGNVVVFDSYDNYRSNLTLDNVADPGGFWIDRSDLLYVIDRKMNTVSIHTTEGKRLHSFGSTGTGDYQFMSAQSVCVNYDGWIFVSDREAHRVVIFRPSRP